MTYSLIAELGLINGELWGILICFYFYMQKKICRKTYESKRKYLMDMSLCIDFGDIFLDLTDIVFRNIKF